MALVALIIGHRESSQGAVAVDGTTEWGWAQKHAERLARALAHHDVDSVVVFREDRSDGYSRLPRRIDETGCDCYIALHFNSVGDSSATGSEVLYWYKSERSKRLAQEMDVADDALGLRDRAYSGILPIHHGGRGEGVLRKPKAPGVMPEPAFGSNPSDWGALMRHGDALAEEQAGAIVRWLRAEGKT